jgi:hypothetical protein
MAAKTHYLQDALINHVLRNSAYTSPTAVYCALYTVSPTDSGGGTEVSGGGYLRQEVTFGSPSDGETSNSLDITFPQASGDWGEIVAFGILDDDTSGNLLYYGDLTVHKTVLSGDIFEFLSGQLDLTEQ